MKGNLARRIEGLEQREGKGKDIIEFWDGPQDDAKVEAAKLLSAQTGRPLLIIRWAEYARAADAA